MPSAFIRSIHSYPAVQLVCNRYTRGTSKKRRLTKKTIDDKLKKLSLVFSFEGVRKRIKGSIIILDSSMAEHPAVNRRVAGSSPARGVFYGPLVKGLRHRPFTAVTRVRIPHGS